MNIKRFRKSCRSDGRRFNRPARIKITTQDIADYVGTTANYIRVAISLGILSFTKNDSWNNFWMLVRYLEKRGLRPTNIV